jgi:hypothetical protein
MIDSTPGANRLKGLLPKGTTVAHKTGTGGTQNGIAAATNDIGIVYLPNGKHLAVAVFVSDSPSDEKTREAVIARIAKAAFDRWLEQGKAELTGQPQMVKCSAAESKEAAQICATIMKDLDISDASTTVAFEITIRPADLNSDGENEIVIWESSWAGTSGGMMWILGPTSNGYRKLFKTEMAWSPIVMLKSRSHGWCDLTYFVSGGGVQPHFVIVRHNGRQYDEVDLARAIKPEGIILIDKNWHQSTFGPNPN